MPVPEMQRVISRLRLTLATIKSREEELNALRRQFQAQLDRAPQYAIYGQSSLEATLGAMGEVQERLDEVETRLRHLAAIRARAEEELGALELTNRIEMAKEELVSLRNCQGSGELSEETRREMQQLERFIQEASIRAGKAITGQVEHRSP